MPLVADIHFLPQAAMEAVEHVEKVRVNPGNYADKKKFAVREYSDADYEQELQRLHDAFSPLVKRAKELGRALRIGTNHGSLSDRVMNRYGDTPLGMVESALEFVRICEAHGFHDIILSMKASNPKIMIQTYRLLVARMDAVHRPYPLHLGVTEAGDGEDGRIKSAIGIGSLLLDGLGEHHPRLPAHRGQACMKFPSPAFDRRQGKMSLRREAPEGKTNAELPMTNDFGGSSSDHSPSTTRHSSSVIGHSGAGRRDSVRFHCPLHLRTPGNRFGDASWRRKAKLVGPEQPPRVIVRAALADLARPQSPVNSQPLKDTPVEGVLVPVATAADLAQAARGLGTRPTTSPAFVVLLELAAAIAPSPIWKRTSEAGKSKIPLVLLRRFLAAGDDALLRDFAAFARHRGQVLACDIAPGDFPPLADCAAPARRRERDLHTFGVPPPPPRTPSAPTASWPGGIAQARLARADLDPQHAGHGGAGRQQFSLLETARGQFPHRRPALRRPRRSRDASRPKADFSRA